MSFSFAGGVAVGRAWVGASERVGTCDSSQLLVCSAQSLEAQIVLTKDVPLATAANIKACSVLKCISLVASCFDQAATYAMGTAACQQNDVNVGARISDGLLLGNVKGQVASLIRIRFFLGGPLK